MRPKGTGGKETANKGSIFAKIRKRIVSKKPLRISPDQIATQKKSTYGSNLFVRFTSSDRPRGRDRMAKELEELRGRVAGLETLNSTYNEDQEILRYQGRMLQHLSVGIMMSRVGDGIIVDTNPGFDLLFGYGPDELQGSHVSVLYASNETSPMEVADDILCALQEHGSWEGEVNSVRADGSMFWSYARVSAFEHSGFGEVWLTVQEDITARKQAEEALSQKARHIQQIMDSLPCFAMILNSKREIMALNKVASEMGGVIGKQCFAIMNPLGKVCSWCKADEALESNEFKNIQTWGGNLFWDIYWVPLEDGLYLHFVFDRTESRKAEEKIHAALKEREVLLAEIHHRVKNNLAIISAFLSLQSNYADDEKVAGMLQESQKRINAMALVHEKLYHNRDFSRIDFREYVESLTGDLILSYGAGKNVSVVNDIDDIALELDTLIPCGLLMNELITNSLVHGFNGTEAPEIRITLKGGDNNVELRVGDNGIGLPDEIDITSTRTLGLRIIRLLAGQLNSEMEIDRRNGTEFRFSFKLF